MTKTEIIVRLIICLRDGLSVDNWKSDKIRSYEYSSLIVCVIYVNTNLMFKKLTFIRYGKTLTSTLKRYLFFLRSARGHKQLLVF